jgi:hypothetical protein
MFTVIKRVMGDGSTGNTIHGLKGELDLMAEMGRYSPRRPFVTHGQFPICYRLEGTEWELAHDEEILISGVKAERLPAFPELLGGFSLPIHGRISADGDSIYNVVDPTDVAVIMEDADRTCAFDYFRIERDEVVDLLDTQLESESHSTAHLRRQLAIMQGKYEDSDLCLYIKILSAPLKDDDIFVQTVTPGAVTHVGRYDLQCTFVHKSRKVSCRCPDDSTLG